MPYCVTPRHFVGLNDAIINLQITSRLPFGFTQSATQGDSKDKSRKPFCVKSGSFHVIHDITNISSVTFEITFPVSKSRHLSGTALKHDHKYAAYAHARFSQNYLDVPTGGNLTMVVAETKTIVPFPPAPHYQIKDRGCGRPRGCTERRPLSAREDSEFVCWCLACHQPAPSKFIRASNPR